MKKKLFLSMFIILCTAIFAQQYEAQSAHYNVISEVDQVHADNTLDILESALSSFNDYFHFDLDSLPNRMTVRIFADSTAMETFVDTIVDVDNDSFVFLQYSDPKKNKLFGWYHNEESRYQTALIHHAFIQYLKTFVYNPPLWLMKGFAVYFESAEIQSDGSLDPEGNLRWLETLRKGLGSRSLDWTDVQTLLHVGSNQEVPDPQAFYAQSWALVKFFLEVKVRDYNRVMWDIISTLDPVADEASNRDAVDKEVFAWIDTTKIIQDMGIFIQSLKTTGDLVQLGIASYGRGDFRGAADYFLEALVRKTDYHLPYYYLGLISYNDNDFTTADFYYQSAMDLGGDPATINYALGVNAYADDRYSQAQGYLESAKSGDAEKYAEKADELLERISKKLATE